MAEFRLERFKYRWRDEWQTGTAYKRDDVVRVNGKSYVCVVTHVSSAVFRDDLNAILPGSNPPQPEPRWTVMTSGRSFEGNWTNGTAYNLGDIVVYDGSLWNCVVSHTASNFAADFDNWAVFAQTTSFVGNWSTGNTYAPGAVVKYNGMSYKCVTAHTAGSTLEDNIDDWVVYHRGIEVRNNWQPSTEYRVNDFVKYGGTVYRCTETHTSNATDLDDSKFSIEVFGSQYDGDWNSTTYYNTGDIVRHRGFMYYAINNNIDSKPFIDSDQGATDWILLARSYSFIGEWNKDSVYKTGDITLRGGNLYLALRDIGGVTDETTGELVSGEQLDGSTVDYLDEETWELLVPGKSFKGNWTSGVEYEVGDVVYYRNSAYTCNFQHTASIQNFPGDNGNIEDYWDLLILGGEQGGLEKQGDLLTFGPNRFIDEAGAFFEDGSTVFDDSSFGNTRVPIGDREQLLSVSDELEVFWRNITEDAESVYVSKNGTDDFDRGTFQKPFRTIRYAAEYVEDNYDPLTPVTIRVSTGRFEEAGPITVPAGCAVHGDELRSTTVVAAPPQEAYQNDYQFVQDYLNHFVSIVSDIVEGNEIDSQEGNEQQQVFEVLEPVLDIDGEPQLDGEGNPVTVDTFPTSNLDGANAVVALLDDFRNYVEFFIESGDTNPSVTGTNIENSNTEIANAGQALLLNREFLQAELLAFLENNYPQTTFNSTKVKNDVYSLLRALARDTKYPGNYATVLSARRYVNLVLGAQDDSLFFMRDTTGLRQLTVEGLRGRLNPPGVFDLYQKPTGGACVSLDPGWGADDERCWIINRSPYIQNVTNIGQGCVGKRVDGSLHNGGNRSMVSNDFTQVLSDGIGVWVSDNGRTELVSVFTYYCQIGYFAEDGGIIRAANGNNSYGRYGSIADGVDDTEVPQEASVFNRNNQAQVLEAFAGGTNDEVLLFEYGNCGENYSQASADITGAGADASVEYTDFRDGALFEARLTSPDGSSSEGGSNYLVRQGSAQELADASTSIKLSQNDITQFFEEIEGMRVIITDGTGVGQYGYATDFDFPTKTVSISRESDDQPGWDHIVPGTPLASAFDLTTGYRIEPRIEVSEPPVSTASANLFTNRQYVDLAFGNTTETYSGVQGGADVIWKDDLQGYVTVSEIISPTQVKFAAYFDSNPSVPFDIRGRTSEAEATVTAISANTDDILEVNLSANGDAFTIGEELDIVLTSGTGETFDGAAVPAEFDVLRQGRDYSVSIASGGSGYTQGDTITILGTQLGGATPDNDLTVTVESVSSDSTNSILAVSSQGTGRQGLFVSLTNSEYARYSEDGTNWTEVELPFVDTMSSLVAGNDRFLALGAQDKIATSLNGIEWSESALPSSASWVDGVYGNGKFVIVADDSDVVLSSTDGDSWTQSSIPDDTDGGADSTTSAWSDITYGKGTYVAVSSSDGATATSEDGIAWTRNDSAVSDFLPRFVCYGNNRYVAVGETSGEVAYSFDAVTWYTLTDSLSDLSGVTFQPTSIVYSNGLFFVVGTDNGSGTNIAFTSEAGTQWKQISLPSSQIWSAVDYGLGDWIVKASSASTDAIAVVNTGARALARADVITGSFQNIKIWNPGSGYTESNPPVLSVTDPNAVVEIAYESRISDSVLSQPDFVNRGTGYRSSTSTISISGDGFADIIPEGSTVTLSGIRNIPGPGVQIEFEGILNEETLVPDDLFIFSGVEVFDLGDDGTGNETRLVQFTVTPSIGVENNLRHTTNATLRERFSQCRLSGHDFLDIGTGNFEDTNYPQIYAGGNFFTARPENEVYETNSGRVFYVSTDQDGNFRAGELFAVQQATGVVTISAQFFDLDGLSELALGGVRLGGSGTVVNEFSTDPTFAADSNNVVPTQRAIATFLADRLSVGGESLEVNRIVAGRVGIGGEDNTVETTTGQYVIIPNSVDFSGTYEADDGEGTVTVEPTAVQGAVFTQPMLLKQFDDTMQ
jgi:hypothetical protein